MDNKNVIIIGAGIAGLSAGCYGQMNGYSTQIFEMHTLPGGVCTSWKRKGYIFDGCIHWLVGTNPEGGFYQIWKELGAIQNREIVNHEIFEIIEDGKGKTLTVFTDVDRFEMYLLELSPADSSTIKEFTAAVRVLIPLSTAPVVRTGGAKEFLKGLSSFLKFLPILRAAKKYSKLSVGDFALKFKDPFLRFAFPRIIVGNMADMPMMVVLATMAWLHMRDAGYTIGGSLEFSRAIERRYRDLGGKVQYGSRVTKILVENDRAAGVRLADGSEHRADYVISAADGHATIFDMLEGRYLDDEIRGYYEKFDLFPPLVMVALGVDGDFSAQPRSISAPLKEPIVIAEEAHNSISIRHYGYDPTLAPSGKTAFVLLFSTEYGYWKDLYNDKERYAAEKQRIAREVIDRLEKRWPGFSDKVEVTDVATPVTLERFTGNWQGSYEGWLITTKTARHSFGKGLKKTLPGLDNFYMIGQWTHPGGGLPPAAMMGRDIIRRLCKRDGKKFEAHVP